MVLVSYTGKEINAKLVFYGPGLCGKTTNLEYIYGSIPSNNRGKMVSMKTKTERTLFFDFLPIDLGELAGFKTRFLLYTVPGQVYYNATRKLVLKGVDAIVFVADSGRGKMEENLESFENLRENLNEHGLSLDEIPYVIQYNKRDLPDVYSVEELEAELNKMGVPSFEAVATKGGGVFDTFKVVSKMLLAKLSREIGAPVKAVEIPGGPQKIQALGAAPGAAPAPVVVAETPVPPVTASLPPATTQAPTPAQPVAQAPPPMRDEPVAPTAAETARGEMDPQKTRGLWRWFKQDGHPGAEVPQGSVQPTQQMPEPKPEPKPEQIPEPPECAKPEESIPGLENGFGEPTPVEPRVAQEAPVATVQPVKPVETVQQMSAEPPVASFAPAPMAADDPENQVAAGEVRVNNNEITIPIRIPARLISQSMVLRLEVHVAGELGQRVEDERVA